MSIKWDIVRKLSTATVYGTVPKMKEGDSMNLFQLMGEIDGYKMGESTFGSYTKFTGNFAAIPYDYKMMDFVLPNGQKESRLDLLSGTLSATKGFKGFYAFLPPPFDQMLKTACDKAASNGNVQLEFKLIVAVKYHPKSNHEYAVIPVVQPRESDAIQRLLAIGSEDQRQLENKPDEVKAVRAEPQKKGK